MHIKYGMELNLDDIINTFAGQHQHRLFFADISQIIYPVVHAIFLLIFLDLIAILHQFENLLILHLG